jgi:hypothetical protein
MKLNELNYNPVLNAQRALKEQYEVPFKVEGMSMTSTKSMLQKVRGLISETKQASDFYRKQTSPAYMKMVFMEQALVHHFNDLRNRPQPRIVFENEEVDKSQVVLAAQDMVDSVQKMVEQVSDMLVKELPALSDSVQSEIGVNEGEQFTSQATEALTGLTAALTQAKTSLQGALNAITGQGGDFGVGAPEEAGADAMAGDAAAGLGGEVGAEMPPMDDMGAEELPAEEPEPEPVAGAGRAKR